MSKLRVSSFSVSIDGFGAGPKQDVKDPLGVGGEALHEWMFPTRTFRQMSDNLDGSTGPDEDFAKRGFENVGAWIMGRNMFGPIRGAWPDKNWKGWWGDNPPYHVPVFVLTHHARAPITMEGGTTFNFVTDGIRSRWSVRLTRLAERMSSLVEELLSSVNMCKRDLLTKFISRYRQFCWIRRTSVLRD